MPLFDDLEQAVIVDVARRINKTLTYTRTAELQAMEMRKLGYSPNKIRTEAMKILNADADFKKSVETNTIEYKKEIKQIIADIVAKAKEEGNEIVANSGDMSWIDDMRVWESEGIPLTDDSFLPMLVRGIQRQIGDEIVNLSNSTGFKAMNGFESIEDLYRTELNKAIMKISSGTFSPQTVTKEVIHNLAQSGLRSIDYASGRSMQIDSAVRLAVRTGCAQLSGKMTDENIQRTEQNLVQVSSHWGARNKGKGIENHEEWQGKVYYIVKPEYSLDDEAKRINQDSIDDIWEKTGYSPNGAHPNNPLGLYGYNCRHRLYPFFEGISEPLKFAQEPPSKGIDGKTYDYYAMTQKMRQMERKIRNLKREREAVARYSNETKSEDLAKIDAKISKATREYKEFCNKCGIQPSSENIRYEANSSDLTKTEAYKQYSKELQTLKTPYNQGITMHSLNAKVNSDDRIEKKNMKNQIDLMIRTTPLEENTEVNLPYWYSPTENKIYKNPLCKAMLDTDEGSTIAHEMGHKYDVIHGLWKRKEWQDIIDKSFLTLKNNEDFFVNYAKTTGNVFVADILSAIASDRIKFFKGFTHEVGYWNTLSKASEIFANITALEFYDNPDIMVIQQYFGDLLEEYWRFFK